MQWWIRLRTTNGCIVLTLNANLDRFASFASKNGKIRTPIVPVVTLSVNSSPIFIRMTTPQKTLLSSIHRQGRLLSNKSHHLDCALSAKLQLNISKDANTWNAPNASANFVLFVWTSSKNNGNVGRSIDTVDLWLKNKSCDDLNLLYTGLINGIWWLQR